MQKVVHVIGSLAFGGACKQLRLLTTALPKDRFKSTVLTLRRDIIALTSLAEAGINGCFVEWPERFDLGAGLRLRSMLRELSPVVIHVWGWPSLRKIVVAGAGKKKRLILSLPPSECVRRFSWLERWFLKQVDRVVVGSTSEAASLEQQFGGKKLVVVPPAVEEMPSPAAEPADLRATLGLSPNARCLVGLGPLESRKGLQDSLWAFDMLRMIYEDLHLVFVGTGPEMAKLQRFTRITGREACVHFVGPLAGVSEALSLAEVVVLPNHVPGSVNAALEAMAAGRPVVASRLPGLADVVRDGETGFLVPPKDKAVLARRIRLLLDDAAQREAMGKAGRKRAAEAFTVDEMVDRYSRLYESLS